MTINTIIFDFGGVLIDWNPRYLYRDLFDDPDKMEWFLENICTGEWNLEQDRGRPLSVGTALLKERFPEHEEFINSFYGKWEDMLKGEIRETVEILYDLKKKYKVYGLTNWSAETFPIALKRFSFLKELDGIVVSGEEEMIKPDKKIFKLLLDRYYLKAENSLFIDDNLDNIKAAAEMGFQTIHFESAEKLKVQLAKMEIT